MHLFITKSPPLSHAFHDISKEQLGSLQIGVVNFIKRKYNVNAIYGADISGTFAGAWNNISQVDVISASPEAGRRRDCVLIERVSGESRARELNTMTNRKVARVVFFFKFKEDLNHAAPGYTYIQWFSTMGPVDPRSGMYTVKRTVRYEVVDVSRIQCGVHLIPKFENTLRASETEVPISHFGPEVFQHFEDFFLNSWINLYQYNSIY